MFTEQGLFTYLILLTSLACLITTGINVWFMIDAIQRYSKDTLKSIFLVLVIWVLPIGFLIYYFAAVPVKQRFFVKTMHKYKGLFGVLLAVLVILLILIFASGSSISEKTKMRFKRSFPERGQYNSSYY